MPNQPAFIAPVYRELTYQPDLLLTLFSSLSHLPWAMLLHSGFANHKDNRFDILVADPRVTITTQGAITTIESEAGVEQSTDDPLALVQYWLERTLSKQEPSADFPFQGGALGAFSYDLGRRFEDLPQQSTQDIDLPEMAIGIYDWAMIADHHQQKVTLICHGDSEARQCWLKAQINLVPQSDFALLGDWQANMSKNDYAKKFAQIQQYLRSGDCYQVNLTQRFQVPYCGDEWQAFLRLNQVNQAPFSAFLRLPQQAVLSLSPERFLSLKGRNIVTRPIKGTRPRSTDPARDRAAAISLASAEKDRAENVMIVDLLRNDIGRIARAGSVKVPELFTVEAFPAVYHLVSTITAELDPQYQASDLLRACFPGGSITGAPKIRAMQIIEELEPQRRSLYCGSIGYLSCCGNMDTSITIRTLLAEKGTLYCWAGGGIVVDSHVDMEYQETLDKVAKIVPFLQKKE